MIHFADYLSKKNGLPFAVNLALPLIILVALFELARSIWSGTAGLPTTEYGWVKAVEMDGTIICFAMMLCKWRTGLVVYLLIQAATLLLVLLRWREYAATDGDLLLHTVLQVALFAFVCWLLTFRKNGRTAWDILLRG